MMFVRMVQPTGGGTEGSFPYWYIIIPVALAIIFIIILAIALYCVSYTHSHAIHILYTFNSIYVHMSSFHSHFFHALVFILKCLLAHLCGGIE